MEVIANQWIRAYLSLKGRVLIANVLILPIVRYAIRFIYPTPEIIKRIEQIYYKLIWNGKDHGVTNRNTTIFPVKQGGLAC